MRYQPLLALAAILACVSGSVAADDQPYVDPSGFSLSCPEDWVLVSKPSSSLINSSLPPTIQSWIKKNNIDFSKVSVVLLRDGKSTFLENVNVVVDHQQMPITDETVKKLSEMLPKQYQSAGVKIDNLDARKRKIGKNEVISIEYQTRFPGVASPLKQLQVFIAGGGNTYIVTCSAMADQFGVYDRTFERILTSFKVPSPVAQQQGFDWSRVITMGLIGGLVAGIAGFAKQFIVKK